VNGFTVAHMCVDCAGIGYCLPPDTLKNICTQIHVESTLYTLVRGTPHTHTHTHTHTQWVTVSQSLRPEREREREREGFIRENAG